MALPAIFVRRIYHSQRLLGAEKRGYIRRCSGMNNWTRINTDFHR